MALTLLSADHEFGLGDASFQAVVAHAINDRWAAAVGTRVVAQTAAGGLGSGEWQVEPVLGVLRYMLFELGEDCYFVPSMRYAMSIPGNAPVWGFLSGWLRWPLIR